MKNILFGVACAMLVVTTGCAQSAAVTPATSGKSATAVTKSAPGSKAYFASGCFWCVEAVFESVEGVSDAISGYSGGKTANPTYEEVSEGNTGHAEAVEVVYDPKVLPYSTLLLVYLASQDPTQVNGQGPDKGSQYRSVIFYQNETERLEAKRTIDSINASGSYAKPLAIELLPFKKFWPAEDYHQNFEANNPNNAYIQCVSKPRLEKFQAKFPQLIKAPAKH